jgi:YegS/Rv2252/BmrU family lipid kinase
VRALLACNPAAHGGRGVRALPAVAARLGDAGVDLDVHRTTSIADARKTACDAAGGVDAVIAMGGDGMVGACAAGLADAGPGARAALGVVPVGGGNDAARAFGLPHDDPVAAAGLLPGLPRRRIDLVRADGRRYLNIAGAGFDSEVNRVANARLRWAPSMLRYVGAMVAKLATERPVRFTVTVDGHAEELAAWLVVVCNGRSYGGGMRVAPEARFDDGLLDVVVIGDLTKPDFLATFPKVYRGRHLEHRLVTVHHARRVELAADRPRTVYADGEHAGELPMAFEVEPGALAVLAAPDAPGLARPA